MGAPVYTWALSLIYVCFLLNHTYDYGINVIPITNSTVSTSDIIPLLRFHFGQPVYYKVDYSYFLPHSTEKCGFWVGITEHVVHAMTFKVLTDDIQNIVFRSNLRSAEEPTEINLRLYPLCGDPYTSGKSRPCRD